MSDQLVAPLSWPELYPKRSRMILSFFCLIIAGGFLPIGYGLVAAGSEFGEVFSDSRGPHILLNAAATGLVMLCSVRLAGRLDRKLASVLNVALLIHGCMAFEILITRQFHSNKVMMVAAVTSAVLGSLVMLAQHVSQRPRVALLGRWHPLADQLRVAYDHFEEPGALLSEYHILLSSDVVDLSPDWSTSLAKAMLKGRQVRHIAEFIEESQGIVSIEHFDLEEVSSIKLTHYRLIKRLIDISIVILTAPITLPFFCVGAGAVWASMGGPVLFTQLRVGLGGQSFTMFKLRTMRPATEEDGLNATAVGDRRVTAVGRVLRRFRVDELPQLWNVLKGDMSIVGPRPEQPSLAKAYISQMPAFVYRELARPGITGWAQVRAGYASDLEETRVKLTYDLYYIKNFSLALDLQILVRTVWTLIGGAGVR